MISQSNELTKGPPELVQHFLFQGEFTSVHEHCMSYTWYGLAKSLACPSGEEGVFSPFKWFLPAFATSRGMGEGVDTLWVICRVYPIWHYESITQVTIIKVLYKYVFYLMFRVELQPNYNFVLFLLLGCWIESSVRGALCRSMSHYFNVTNINVLPINRSLLQSGLAEV